MQEAEARCKALELKAKESEGRIENEAEMHAEALKKVQAEERKRYEKALRGMNEDIASQQKAYFRAQLDRLKIALRKAQKERLQIQDAYQSQMQTMKAHVEAVETGARTQLEQTNRQAQLAVSAAKRQAEEMVNMARTQVRKASDERDTYFNEYHEVTSRLQQKADELPNSRKLEEELAVAREQINSSQRKAEEQERRRVEAEGKVLELRSKMVENESRLREQLAEAKMNAKAKEQEMMSISMRSTSRIREAESHDRTLVIEKERLAAKVQEAERAAYQAQNDAERMRMAHSMEVAKLQQKIEVESKRGSDAERKAEYVTNEMRRELKSLTDEVNKAKISNQELELKLRASVSQSEGQKARLGVAESELKEAVTKSRDLKKRLAAEREAREIKEAEWKQRFASLNDEMKTELKKMDARAQEKESEFAAAVQAKGMECAQLLREMKKECENALVSLSEAGEAKRAEDEKKFKANLAARDERLREYKVQNAFGLMRTYRRRRQLMLVSWGFSNFIRFAKAQQEVENERSRQTARRETAIGRLVALARHWDRRHCLMALQQWRRKCSEQSRLLLTMKLLTNAVNRRRRAYLRHWESYTVRLRNAEQLMRQRNLESDIDHERLERCADLLYSIARRWKNARLRKGFTSFSMNFIRQSNDRRKRDAGIKILSAFMSREKTRGLRNAFLHWRAVEAVTKLRSDHAVDLANKDRRLAFELVFRNYHSFRKMRLKVAFTSFKENMAHEREKENAVRNMVIILLRGERNDVLRSFAKWKTRMLKLKSRDKLVRRNLIHGADKLRAVQNIVDRRKLQGAFSLLVHIAQDEETHEKVSTTKASTLIAAITARLLNRSLVRAVSNACKGSR